MIEILNPLNQQVLHIPYSIEDLECNHISVNLQDVGSLHIDSIPSGANIYIDGVPQQPTTPAIIYDIPIGLRRYKLTYPGYIDVERDITINTGETNYLFVDMERIPCTTSPLSSPWWLLGMFAIGGFMLLSSREEQKNKKIQI